MKSLSKAYLDEISEEVISPWKNKTAFTDIIMGELLKPLKDHGSMVPMGFRGENSIKKPILGEKKPKNPESLTRAYLDEISEVISPCKNKTVFADIILRY